MAILYLPYDEQELKCVGERQIFGQLVDRSKIMTVWKKVNIIIDDIMQTKWNINRFIF